MQPLQNVSKEDGDLETSLTEISWRVWVRKQVAHFVGAGPRVQNMAVSCGS